MIISPNTIFFRTSVNSISMFKAMSLQMWHIWYYFLSSYDIFETLRLSYTHARKNNKIEQRSYSNHEFGCYIKSNFACCNIRKPSLSINMLKHDRTILLFYQSHSIMLTVLWYRDVEPTNLKYFYACSSMVRASHQNSDERLRVGDSRLRD